KLHITGEEVAEEVARTKPRIALGAGGGFRGRGAREPESGTTSISITPWQMQPGEDKVVADRLHGILAQNRSPKPEMAAPSGNISGRWDVSIEFFSSKSHHTLFIEQDGNHIKGSHKGDFSVREVSGTIEGDQVKLHSMTAERGTGDSVPFIFAGAVSGDTISGPIYMGEYLNAKFTAKRHAYAAARGTILIPGGPPLAN
ncbi:MAG TPA: hypothetical protein VEU62_09145, partial [Bryobacterales bacterium]|nr:hypothetical protein [Bryobacterales bacterium]